MQVCCKVYGLVNASSAVECAVERDLLAVGAALRHNDRDYLIISVVESQGCWFANVVPEYQRHLIRHLLPSQRRQEDGEPAEAGGDEWRHRVAEAERKAQALQAEQQQFGERLDHLVHMLELLTKERDAPPHESHDPLRLHKGGEHVR